MDFYRINEEYNRYLQKYERENRGVTKVPNIRYTDRNKFAFQDNYHSCKISRISLQQPKTAPKERGYLISVTLERGLNVSL